MTSSEIQKPRSHRLSNEIVRDAFTTLQKRNDLDQKDGTPNLRLGVAAYLDGEYEIAKAFFERAHREAVRGGNQTVQAKALLNRGNVSFARNDFEGALKYYEEAVKLFDELADPLGKAEATLRNAEAHIQRNNFEKALQEFKESLKTFQNLNQPGRAFVVQLKLALLWVLLGDFGSARELIADAQRKAENGDRGKLELMRSFVEAKYLFGMGKFQEIRKMLATLKPLAPSHTIRDTLQVQLELILAEVFLELEEYEKAGSILDTSTFRRMTQPPLDCGIIYQRLSLKRSRYLEKPNLDAIEKTIAEVPESLKSSFSYLELLVEALEVSPQEKWLLEAFQLVDRLRNSFPLNYEINLLTHPTVLRLHRIRNQSINS